MKQKICFIVAGMEKRIKFLNDCISCYKTSRYFDVDIYLYFQGDNFDSVVGSDIFKYVVIDSNPRGVFTPRYELMKRFGKDYDYVIVIDDDLFIQNDTDYYQTIEFLEANKMVGAACLSESRNHVKNEISIVSKGDLFNVRGGLVLPKKSVDIILDYFKDKEKDYSFDCFWLLIWVFGYDLAVDYRSFARHVCARKIDGQYTGFNASLVEMKYVPFLTEYFHESPVMLRYGSYTRDIPTIADANQLAIETRNENRRRMLNEKSVRDCDDQ